MLIVANTLALNGGTTFVLRFCRESFRRGKRVGVLVMMGNPDKALLSDIEKYADVYFLSSFMSPICRPISGGPVVGFMPVCVSGLSDVIEKYDVQLHVMGVFGLLFVGRLTKLLKRKLKVSIGVYHQNEFMFFADEYYFIRESRRLFSILGWRGVIFFNEANVRSYARFYRCDFSRSTLVPIGIDLPKMEKPLSGDSISRRIVSIGSLVKFKSYASHVIKCMPELISIDANFRYEIYGEGPCEDELRSLASELGVSQEVQFKGAMPYSQLASTLNGALLFVGSGTAVVEAAAMGVPALVGIESSKEPVTYGFISEIEGFSYNESEAGRPTYFMVDRIRRLVIDSDEWFSVATGCKRKAETFSIANTIKGFDDRLGSSAELDPEALEGYSNVRACGSFLLCALKHMLGIDKAFANRRNQGTVV